MKLAACFVGAVFIISIISIAVNAKASDGLAAGTAAPDFRLPLADGTGEVRLSDFMNKKIVIVHFWKSK
jgi:Cu/Ag efflux protein CusF